MLSALCPPRRLGRKPANVLIDRICLNNGIRHILTAPPIRRRRPGRVERLHRTLRKDFYADKCFDTIEEMQSALDVWVADYNNEREHQSLGDVPPVRRFELARPASLTVLDGDVAREGARSLRRRSSPAASTTTDASASSTSAYHVCRHLAGEAVSIESLGGLLHISHNGTIVATHARRHLIDGDDRMD